MYFWGLEYKWCSFSGVLQGNQWHPVTRLPDLMTSVCFNPDFVWLQNHQANGCKTKVIGAPKTIDGDLKYLWRFSSFSCEFWQMFEGWLKLPFFQMIYDDLLILRLSFVSQKIQWFPNRWCEKDTSQTPNPGSEILWNVHWLKILGKNDDPIWQIFLQKDWFNMFNHHLGMAWVIKSSPHRC